MALSITDLKKGTIFELDGVPYMVVEYGQKVLGRGGSIVNVKVKSLLDGKVLDKTFKGSELISEADVANVNAQYLYKQDDKLFFMDEKSFEIYQIEESIVGEPASYLKEGDKVTAQSYNQRIINVELPKNVYLEVTYAEDAVKGDTSSAITKLATLETGAIVRVPAFIKAGDVISIDTSSGAYRERKK